MRHQSLRHQSFSHLDWNVIGASDPNECSASLNEIVNALDFVALKIVVSHDDWWRVSMYRVFSCVR